MEEYCSKQVFLYLNKEKGDLNLDSIDEEKVILRLKLYVLLVLKFIIYGYVVIRFFKFLQNNERDE